MSLAPKDTVLPLLAVEATPAPVPATFDHAMEERIAGPASSTLTSALERLEELVREESHALRMRTPIDFAEISRRKSRSLLELSRVARAVPPRLDAGTAERVRALREELQQNFELLGVHLAAAQEVGTILHGALRDAESDGTYSTTITYGGSAT
ncbi:hypothetical protein ABLE91_01945 [Aquabacter sp. CN5-332]|uniref:hypothetical protein n=1 Tax=Aquabacter sp. CN5-332 TaxID=3156608 RepID=UPI0032B37FF7